MNKQDAIDVLNRYMDGKDNVKKDVLKSAFSNDGKVTFDIRVENINFPDELNGNEQIASEMFGDFHDAFSQVKSYYLDQDFIELDQHRVVNQHWLVSMKERDSGNTRIGSGLYNWYFQKDDVNGWVISHVHIVIQHMVSFDNQTEWLSKLQYKLTDYPWANKNEVVECLNECSELAPISTYLSEDSKR